MTFFGIFYTDSDLCCRITATVTNHPSQQLMVPFYSLGSVFGSDSGRSGTETGNSGSADSGWVRGSDGEWNRKTSSWSSWSSKSGSSQGGSGGTYYGGSGAGGSYGYERENGIEGEAAEADYKTGAL